MFERLTLDIFEGQASNGENEFPEEFLVDSDGYPLLPNGNLFCVFKDADQKPNVFNHFSNWQFGQCASRKYRCGDQMILSLLKHCRGVYKCPNEACITVSRPKQKLDAELADSKVCKTCSGPLEMIECSAKLKFDTCMALNTVIMRHSGVHDHQCPPVTKPDYYAMQRFGQIVSQAPERTPWRMVVGSVAGLHGENNSVRKVHPAFGNRDRVAYVKKNLLAMGQLKLSGLGPFADFVRLHELYGSVVKSCSLDPPNMHVTVQTEWMKQALQDIRDNFGRKIGGVISDVTHSFFKAGFLLSSSVYCRILQRWVPVAFSWIYGQTAAHHVQHFVVLINGILELDLTYEEQNELMAQVIDYSIAQKNAFIQAYCLCRTNDSKFDPKSPEELLAEANQLFRGILY